MGELLLAAASLILLAVAVGLARVLRGPSDVERLMALQLLGTGGIAALLLIAYATSVPGVDDVALGFALLAALDPKAPPTRRIPRRRHIRYDRFC